MKRAGYRNFLEFILCFAQLNKDAHEMKATFDFTIRLPIKWF